MKNIIKTVAFLLVSLACILIIQKEFIPFNAQDTNQTETFYKLPENTVDVAFIGTSPILVGISPLELFEETGITSQVWGSSSQLAEITYFNVKELLKTQSPRVIACSDRSLLHKMEVDEYEGHVRRGMDFKKLSLDKIVVANGLCDDSTWQTEISFVFPLLRYHSRWEEILDKGLDTRGGAYDYMHGQYPVYKTKAITYFENEEGENDKPIELDPNAIYWYEKAIDLCHSKGIEFMFIEMPTKSIRTYAKHQVLVDFAQKHNIGLLDFNVGYNDLYGTSIKDDLGIDLMTDYYDANHMNPRGATKATKYIGEYLVKTYGLKPSQVSKSVKNTFETDYKKYMNDLKEKGYNSDKI